MAAATTIHNLPEDCLARVISLTTPRKACQSLIVSAMFRDSAESDLVWDKFLPCDYRDIISKLVSPMEFSSKRDLFFKLSTPLLIDGGGKTFAIDKNTSKKCYMLSARELSITWGSNPLCWSWKPLLHSRFAEGVELVMVCWLEIEGKVNTRILSKNTTYRAYLVVKIVDRAFGLGSVPSEVSVEVGDYRLMGTTYLRSDECRGKHSEYDFKQPKNEDSSRSRVGQEEERFLYTREDGWLEVELGEFYCNDKDKEVKMSLKEVNGDHLKGGLLVEGIELRPKC